jgi:hypothetical protein
VPEVSYFVRVGADHPADRPMGVYRRTHTAPPTDEAYGRDQLWRPTEALCRAELGSADATLVPVAAELAEAVLARWRHDWGAAPDVTRLGIEEARAYLRAELAGAAAAAYPEVTPVVERDKGPLPVGVEFDGGDGTVSAPVTVATGHRGVDPARDVAAAVDYLAGHGWQVTGVEPAPGRHRAAAALHGFSAVVRLHDEDGILRLSGETPPYRRHAGRWRRVGGADR